MEIIEIPDLAPFGFAVIAAKDPEGTVPPVWK